MQITDLFDHWFSISKIFCFRWQWLQGTIKDLDWFSSSSAWQEEVEDATLSHDIHGAGGQESITSLLVMWTAVEHGGSKDGGQVVEWHLVMLLHAGHPHQVFHQEHNTRLVGAGVNILWEFEGATPRNIGKQKFSRNIAQLPVVTIFLDFIQTSLPFPSILIQYLAEILKFSCCFAANLFLIHKNGNICLRRLEKVSSFTKWGFIQQEKRV